jgi:hypothetical protein
MNGGADHTCMCRPTRKPRTCPQPRQLPPSSRVDRSVLCRFSFSTSNIHDLINAMKNLHDPILFYLGNLHMIAPRSRKPEASETHLPHNSETSRYCRMTLLLSARHQLHPISCHFSSRLSQPAQDTSASLPASAGLPLRRRLLLHYLLTSS